MIGEGVLADVGEDHCQFRPFLGGELVSDDVVDCPQTAAGEPRDELGGHQQYEGVKICPTHDHSITVSVLPAASICSAMAKRKLNFLPLKSLSTLMRITPKTDPSPSMDWMAFLWSALVPQ